MGHGTNSFSPMPLNSLLVFSPEACRRSCSKMRCPISAIVASPSMITPQLTSMSACMRVYIGVLEASFIVGAGTEPKQEPRPVVKQTMLAPPAIWPVAEAGS